MLQRAIRIVQLDSSVFKDIARDPNATAEAAIIVAIASLLSGIGSWLSGSGFVGGVLWGLISGLLFWVLWSVITYFVGTMLFQGKTTIEEMLRVLGYANAPRALGLFAFIPCLGAIASFIGAVLALIAGVIAIMQAMEFDVGKAIVTVLIGWVVLIIVMIVLSPILGLGFLIFH